MLKLKEWQQMQEMRRGIDLFELFRREAPWMTLVFFWVCAYSTRLYQLNWWMMSAIFIIGLCTAYVYNLPGRSGGQHYAVEIGLAVSLCLLVALDHFASRAAFWLQGMSPYMLGVALSFWVQRYIPSRKPQEPPV